MNQLLLLITLLIPTGLFCQLNKTNDKPVIKPNIVFILADDLGYGDLGCYGQKKFSTPNLDKLAAGGMLFTQHYAGCTVCAPSRSSLMTGQHTGHTPIRGNKGWDPEGQWPLKAEAYTLAEMLRDAGYTTGGFGKWGLGYIGTDGDPNKQGFDQFFGFNCQSLAHNYFPGHLWSNQDKVILEKNQGVNFGSYAPELIHKQALKFIDKNNPSKTGKPFFLFYPSTIPHAELLLPEKNLAEFRGKFLPEKVFKGANPGDKGFREGPYGSQNECHAAFAAMVTYLDKQVGEIVSKLKKLGLENNTIILFSSDNGPHVEGGADPDYFDSNGPLRGYKRDVYEGGIRTPLIVYWPEKIKKGTTSDHISAFWDVMPTIADIIGINPPKNIDGISFLPTLLGKSDQTEHPYMYWEFHELGGRQAVRKGNWKLVKYNALIADKTKVELYDLSTDLGETNDLSAKYPELVSELLQVMDNSRVESKDFPFKKQK